MILPVQFAVERLSWICFFCIIGYPLVTEIAGIVSEFDAIVIDTDLSLRPLEAIPFPAVIINTGGAIDPLGYVRHSQEVATEADLPERGHFSVLFPSDQGKWIILPIFFTELQGLEEAIFYKAFTLLHRDILSFFEEEGKDVLKKILDMGLASFTMEDLALANHKSRMRFLVSYIDELRSRNASQIRDGQKYLLLMIESLQASNHTTAELEFVYEHIERVAASRESPLTKQNLERIDPVRSALDLRVTIMIFFSSHRSYQQTMKRLNQP